MSCHPGHDPECSIHVLFVSEILNHTTGFRVFASLPGMTMKLEYGVSSLTVKFFNQLINFRGERKNTVPVRIVIVPL
jgi:hypothetical protein